MDGEENQWAGLRLNISGPAVLFLLLCAFGLTACGEKSEHAVHVPDLPTFDENTEEAVAATIREHHQRLKAEPTLENLKEYGMVLQAHRRNELALDAYKEILRVQPDDFESLYLCGRILKRSYPEQARDFLERAVKLRAGYAPAQLDLAEALGFMGEHEAAVEHARRALALDKSPAAEFALARNLISLGREKEALGYLEHLFRLDPQRSEVLNLLSRAYTTLGMKKKAEEVAWRIANVENSSETMLSNNEIMRRVLLKGQSYQSLLSRVIGALKVGRNRQAMEWISQRIARKPEDGVNYAYRGDAYMGMKRYGEAVASFEKAHELASTDPMILVKLATAQVLNGNIPAGYRAIVKARRMAPKNPEVRYIYATHIWQKRPEDALRELEAALRYDPEHLDARVLRAKILFVLKRAGEARQEIRRILERDPGNARATGLLEQYRALPD